MLSSKPVAEADSTDFSALFNLKELQRIQDDFAEAAGVASIITRPNGSHLTAPSNLRRLCREFILRTEPGVKGCRLSAALVCQGCGQGPLVRLCQSAGLWTAGAGIIVEGRHAANWLIGQVRDKTQDEEEIMARARRIGADERAFLIAFRELPAMSGPEFERIARLLSVSARQVSLTARRYSSSAEDIPEEAEEAERRVAQLRQARKLEAVGRLAAGVAHDFNNVLQAVNGYTQIMLLDKGGDHPDHGHLTGIRKTVERASQLVQQMLFFCRKVEPEKRLVNLNQEVEQAVRILRRTIPKMISVEYAAGGGLWNIRADPMQVEQILLNLGINAADAMPEGGRLTIRTANAVLGPGYFHSCSEAGNYVLLTVSDTGQGIEEETLEHIFEPFYTTKEPGKGTGLGLASVYGMVISHGGHIRCQSQPGEGASFRIYFPAAGAEDIKAETEAEDSVLRGGKESILLVDDDDSIREIGRQILEHFGYAVITAASGEEALGIYGGAKNKQIKLVILDIGMPGMGGTECLHQLVEADPAVKVMITSGYSADHELVEKTLAECAGYVGKPYNLGDLVSTVRRILDS